MKQFSKELGKVSITPKGNWDSSITNERLDIVYDRRNNQAYIAKQDVPIGVDIDNREYWQPLNVSGYADNNFINLTAENENGTITAYESLEEAVATIFPINRRVGATLSFYNLNSDRLDRQAEFELWQFNSTDLANWENKDYWNNIYYNWNVFAGWYIDADALTNHVNVPNVGQYAYVGSNLNDAILYQCRTNGTWTNTGIKVRNYISVVVSGNITIGENGNWFSDGEDTGIPATPAVDEQLDNIITKHESLSRTVQGIAATGGASTATNVTYDNDASGLNAENAQDAIDEVSSIGHFAKRGGIVNISTNYNSTNTAEVLTLEQAIAKVPSADRVLGFIGTFLTSNGWESYQFIGSSISEWLNVKKWKEGNTSKFSTLGFYSDSKLKVGEPYIDPDTGLNVVNVTLNSLGSNGTFMDFSGAWSNSSDSLDKSTSCPIEYGAVYVCCKQEDSTSLKIVGIGYGYTSIGKYSSTEFFKSHKGWNINIIAYFYNGNLVLDNTINTKYLSDRTSNIIFYPKKGFELNASYAMAGEANRIWCVSPKAFGCNNEIIGVVIDCGNKGTNTTLTVVKVKDGVPAEELKSIEVYKRGIYTVYFDSPISLSDEFIGVKSSNLNIGYKLNNGDYSFYEFLESGSRFSEFHGATLNIAFLEKKNAITEKIGQLQNRALGNLGFYSLLEAEVSNSDNGFKIITFKNLEKGVSYVDFGSGSYIDNATITIESSSIKVPNNYAIIGLATKRIDNRHSIAKLICWGIGNSEEGINSEYNSEKVLSQYQDYSINVLAYYQNDKVYLNSIPNLYNKIEANNNDAIILQSKYGFIKGNITGVSGDKVTSYWTFNLLDSLSDPIDILGVVVEACSAGTIEVVKIHKKNPISVEVLTSKEVEKAGVYKIWFDSPVSVDNNYNIGVNSTNNAGNATFRYKLDNNDYGLTEYHESNGVVSIFSTYIGATLNIALLRKRDANTLAGEEASIPAFSHIDAPIIYNTYIDSKGVVPALERNYQAIIQLDHLLKGLSEEYNIRFDNNKDVIQTSAPVYVNNGSDFSTASYVVLDGQQSKEYSSDIKVLFEGEPVYKFTLANRCVKASVSKNKKPLVLCIGDSITDGQQALLYEDNLESRYSFHDICLEMFMKDKIDAGNSGYDIEMLGTISRSRKFRYNNEEYTVKTYHEGYGGSTAAGWLNGTVGNGVFKKDDSTLFSIKAWVDKYRTLDDKGKKLYFGTNRETTGVAGDNWGYYEDGLRSNYKLGTLVSNVESYNVCVPTHIHINLGANATTSVEQWQTFIDIIHSEYPNIIIGLSVFDTAGTYFPSLHRDYDDSFCFWNENKNNPNIGIEANVSYHDKQFNTQVNLQNFYNKENEKVYVLPFFYCTPSVESASYRRLSAPLDDLLGRQPSKLMYGWGGVYHINPLAHSYCAYQFYSWLKWTLK